MTIVMEVLVSERKCERELCGGRWEAHGGVKKAKGNGLCQLVLALHKLVKFPLPNIHNHK